MDYDVEEIIIGIRKAVGVIAGETAVVYLSELEAIREEQGAGGEGEDPDSIERAAGLECFEAYQIEKSDLDSWN